MDHSYPYIASLTREPFLFYEMRTTAKLMCGAFEVFVHLVLASFAAYKVGRLWKFKLSEVDEWI